MFYLIIQINKLREMKKKLVKFIDEKFFPDFQNNWDDKLFCEKVTIATLRILSVSQQ